MALWLFRRRSKRQRARSEGDSRRGRRTDSVFGSSSPTGATSPTQDAAEVQPRSKRRVGTEPNKLQRRVRAYSFSPGRKDVVTVQGKRRAQSPSPEKTQDEQIPTLRGKRGGGHLNGPRKSSKKRRKDNQTREAEIRAMSNFVPHRPATEDWNVGRPLRKDSRKVKTGLGDRAFSNVSLPTVESLRSSGSSDSEHASFKVSAFEALAPRPTLRYAPNSTETTRTMSQRRKLAKRETIPEATLKAHKRVDDLADDLDSSDLRELMERDQRRRERKRQRDQEKLQSRLARQADKVKSRQGQDQQQNLERGVLGRESVGLGIDPASAVRTSSTTRHADSPVRTSSATRQPDSQHVKEHVSQHIEETTGPLATFHRTDSLPVVTPLTPPREPDDRMSPPPTTITKPVQTKRTRSPSPTTTEEKAARDNRGPLSWTSIFKWSNRTRRSSRDPSSFSNTSRDSMQMASQPIPTPPIMIPIPRKISDSRPKRTRSRFREDLPELPAASPDLDFESNPIPPTIAEASPDPDTHTDGMAFASSSPTAHCRFDTPTSGMDISRQTPSSMSRHDEIQSMSLASIDSEASWLSGGLARRPTSAAALARGLHARYPTSSLDDASSSHQPETEVDEEEEMSVVDDEYISGVAGPAGWKRKSTGQALPSSDEDDNDNEEDDDDHDTDHDHQQQPQWRSVHGQQPTLITNRTANRIKSREGVLNSFDDEEEEAEDEVDGSKTPASTVQRATSIILNKHHVRNFSAGSAILLDITPRASIDVKRSSLPPRSS